MSYQAGDCFIYAISVILMKGEVWWVYTCVTWCFLLLWSNQSWCQSPLHKTISKSPKFKLHLKTHFLFLWQKMEIPWKSLLQIIYISETSQWFDQHRHTSAAAVAVAVAVAVAATGLPADSPVSGHDSSRNNE